METTSKPHYLYKILSIENWKKSQSQSFLLLSKDDDDFIHLAAKDQLKKITEKYWSNTSEAVILKLDIQKLVGRLIYETNPGGSNKYYHLYDGLIPLEAVLEVEIMNKYFQEK